MLVTLLLLSLIPGGVADLPADLGDAALAPASFESSACLVSGVETALVQFKVGFSGCRNIPCTSCEWCCEEACPWGDPCLGNCWYECDSTCT